MILQSATEKKERANNSQFETDGWNSQEEDYTAQRNNELLVALNTIFETSQTKYR